MIRVGGIGVVSYQYRLDAGDWLAERPVSEPITFDVSEEGSHVLSVIGKNAANMWQSTENPTVVAWQIDVTPPAARLYNYPSGTIDASGAQVVVTGKGVTSYRYRIDGGEWSPALPVSKPILLADLILGEHQLEAIGADDATNWQDEASAASTTWTHDPSVPTAVLKPIPNSVSKQTSIDIGVTSPENGIPIEAYAYTIDGGFTWWSNDAQETIALAGLNEGTRTLCVNAFGGGVWQDGFDGVSSTENATCIEWRVDLTPTDPPVLTVDADTAPGGGVVGMPGTVSARLAWQWTSDDALETVQRYRLWISEAPLTEALLGDATEIFCDLTPGEADMPEAYTIGGLVPGIEYYFGVKTLDGAGNLSQLSLVVAFTPEGQLPKISAFELTEGGLVADNASAREISIEGLNFLETSGCNIVRFENASRVFDIVSKTGTQTRLLADIPVGAPPADYRVRVINKNGISPASLDIFTIVDSDLSMPVVTAIYPLMAEVGLQTLLTVQGENFDQEGVSVNLLSGEGVATPLVDAVVHDAQTVTAIIDGGQDIAEGQYHVQVVNSDGKANHVSAAVLELCQPLAITGDTRAGVSARMIRLENGVIPAKITLTTDNRNEVTRRYPPTA